MRYALDADVYDPVELARRDDGRYEAVARGWVAQYKGFVYGRSFFPSGRQHDTLLVDDGYSRSIRSIPMYHDALRRDDR